MVLIEEEKIDIIKALISKLNEATVAYDKGAPIMSDRDWDNLYFQLQELEKETNIIFNNSPTHKVVFETVSKLEKVTHDYPMKSLNKTKSVDEIADFLKDHYSVMMYKMDGLSCRLIYEDGKLVGAATRGNGLVGENILHNVKCIKNIPNTIPRAGRVIVDGEVILPLDLVPEGKNSRNLAAGSIRLLNSEESYNRNLKFIAWDFIEGSRHDTLFYNRLEELEEELGFEVTLFYPIEKGETANSIQVSIENTRKSAELDNYPIDGIVFRWDSIEDYVESGSTEHHPNGAIAFKFYDELYETKLVDIEWGMGRTGVLTPVAIYEPVEIDGTECTRASLHNISVMKATMKGVPFVGEPVKVAKINQIIPQIVEVDSFMPDGAKSLYIPDICPVCGGPTVIKNNDGIATLWCNNSNCSGKLLNKLVHFVGKKGLDIKGISEATINDLMDWGWVECCLDLFDLASHRNEWINKAGYGETSVDNILTALNKTKSCSLSAFISSLGIPLIGTTVAKQIAKKCGSYDNFKNCVDNEEFRFDSWDGFGEAMNHAIKDFDFTEADALAKIIMPIEEENTENSNDLQGKVFCVTGKLKLFKNRAELVKEIEKRGGKVTGSVSKNTNYLINNDINSTTEKNLKAKSLNIPILTEEDFKNL